MYCFRKHSSFKSAFIPPPQRMSHRPSPPSGQPTKPVVVSSVSLRSESGWTCSCQTLIYSLHGHAYPTSGDTLIRSVLYLVYYIVYSYDCARSDVSAASHALVRYLFLSLGIARSGANKTCRDARCSPNALNSISSLWRPFHLSNHRIHLKVPSFPLM